MNRGGSAAGPLEGGDTWPASLSGALVRCEGLLRAVANGHRAVCSPHWVPVSRWEVPRRQALPWGDPPRCQSAGRPLPPPPQASEWEEDLEDIQAAMQTMREMLRGTQSSLASLNREKRELLERKNQAEARMKSSKESASSRRWVVWARRRGLIAWER